MRNLKRALSLALASVMLLGMMVVGTSAASYPDVDENDNVEAIEVLNAVNVMIGRQGNFEPDEAVNRHEMAVIMAKLVLGVDTADNYVGTHPFTDVVPWADKYVAACYENGLVAGTSATTYGGGSPLTAVQAAAMMLRALGYKDLNKGYQGDWRAPITAMANQIRLFSGVASNPNEKLNRNQVAQLALNTLKSPMVNLKDGTFTATDGNGQLIISGGSREYIALSSQEAYARAINAVESKGTSASAIGGYTVELGEHLYNGKLKLNSRDTDAFGRPTRTWEYDGKKIGSYIKEELMVKNDVGEVTGSDLYNLLGSSTIKDYDLDVYVDGVNDPAVYDAIKDAVKDNTANTGVVFNKTDLNRNNKAGIGATGTGVLMQVFVDPDEGNNGKIWISVINTYLAIADKAYDEKKEEASIEVFDLAKDATKAVYAKTEKAPKDPVTKEYVKKSQKFTLGNEDFALVKDIKKDNPYLVTVADGAIQTIVPAETISDATISAFKRFDHVVTGGTTYKFTTTAGYNYEDLYTYTSEDLITQNLKELTYTIYLDAYGNLIGLKAGEGPKNYVFITSIDRNGSYVSNKTATANAIFTDGTSATISINMDKSKWVETNRNASKDVNNFANPAGDSLLNTWCTYTKSGDVYTVKEVWDLYDETNNKWDDAVRLPGSTASGTVNNTKLGQFRNMLDIPTATPDPIPAGGQITLKDGLRLSPINKVTGANRTGKYANIYGDSSSVYMTADMGKVVNNGTDVYGVIKGVDSVFKGIDGTDITVWTLGTARTQAKVGAGDPTANGVYTLFNSDGIVIASVIVGEGSSAKDLVYVTSDNLSLEEDNGGNAKAAGDGKWTFHREVVRNGEKVMLTEVGESVSALSAANMQQYAWYQIKTNGDGNVVDATPAFEALGDYNTVPSANYGKDIFVVDYEDINDAVEKSGIDTVLYHTNAGPNDDEEEGIYPNPDYTNVGFDGKTKLSVKGNNVLAVDTKEGSGIYFRSNVNVVWTRYNRNTNSTEVIIDTGVDAVKAAVDFVNENTDACVKDHGGRRINAPDGRHEDFFVSALIQNGAATTIAIQDRYNDYSRPADTTQYDQKLYLTGKLGGTFYTNNTSVFTIDDEGNRTPVSVDKDWDTWNSTERRYTIKSGSDVLIIDSDIKRATYAPYFSSDETVTETLPKVDGAIRFTMPKADVTIYDSTPDAGISAEVDLTGAKIGPNGATVTFYVDENEETSVPGIQPRTYNDAKKVAKITITLDKDGNVTNVKIEPVSATAEKVIKVTIKTGANSSDVTITNNAAQPKDVAVEAPTYVAKATVVDDKITKIEYNDAKLAAGESMNIVDEKGNPVTGTVAKAADNTVSVKDATIANDATINNGKETNDLATDGTVGEKVETFAVTITPNDKVTVTSEPATLTGLKSGTKVTLTVAVKDAAKDEIKSVKAGTETLTATAGKYEFTVSADVTVTIETQAKGGGITPAPESDKYFAELNSAGTTYEFYTYQKSYKKLDAAQVITALTSAINKDYPSKKVKAVEILLDDLTQGKAQVEFEDGSKKLVDFSTATGANSGGYDAPKALIQVSYEATGKDAVVVCYMKSGVEKKPTGFPNDIAVIEKVASVANNKSSADIVVDKNGTVTGTVDKTADVTYVDAVQLVYTADTGTTDETILEAGVKYRVSEDAGLSATHADLDLMWFPVGTKVEIKQGNNSDANEKYQIKMNGTVQGEAKDGSGSPLLFQMNLTPDKDHKAVITLEKVTNRTTEATLDGKPVTITWPASGNPFILTDKAVYDTCKTNNEANGGTGVDNSKYAIIAVAKNGEVNQYWGTALTIGLSDDGTKTKIDLGSTTLTEDKDGKVTLVSATLVKTVGSNGTLTSAPMSYKGDKGLDFTFNGATGKLAAVGSVITATSTAAGKYIGVKAYGDTKATVYGTTGVTATKYDVTVGTKELEVTELTPFSTLTLEDAASATFAGGEAASDVVFTEDETDTDAIGAITRSDVEYTITESNGDPARGNLKANTEYTVTIKGVAVNAGLTAKDLIASGNVVVQTNSSAGLNAGNSTVAEAADGTLTITLKLKTPLAVLSTASKEDEVSGATFAAGSVTVQGTVAKFDMKNKAGNAAVDGLVTDETKYTVTLTDASGKTLTGTVTAVTDGDTTSTPTTISVSVDMSKVEADFTAASITVTVEGA